jgi:8-oxo-dGTP pyrophosphatase MutT (NUDIX family)
LAELDPPEGVAPPGVHRWLDRWPARDLPREDAGAAVMILLREGHGGVEVLLIERTVRAEDPASGHVALPGGRLDDGDATMRVTALRELQEEVGLRPADLFGMPRLVGVEVARLFGLRVAVFAAALGPSPEPVPASPQEVAHVFWLPVSALDHPESVERPTNSGPRDVPAIVHDGHVLWGFTYRLLRQFFERPEP